MFVESVICDVSLRFDVSFDEKLVEFVELLFSSLTRDSFSTVEAIKCQERHVNESLIQTQLAFTCSKLRIEILEQDVKYVQS